MGSSGPSEATGTRTLTLNPDAVSAVRELRASLKAPAPPEPAAAGLDRAAPARGADPWRWADKVCRPSREFPVGTVRPETTDGELRQRFGQVRDRGWKAATVAYEHPVVVRNPLTHEAEAFVRAPGGVVERRRLQIPLGDRGDVSVWRPAGRPKGIAEHVELFKGKAENRQYKTRLAHDPKSFYVRDGPCTEWASCAARWKQAPFAKPGAFSPRAPAAGRPASARAPRPSQAPARPSSARATLPGGAAGKRESAASRRQSDTRRPTKKT